MFLLDYQFYVDYSWSGRWSLIVEGCNVSNFMIRPMEEQRQRYGPPLYSLTQLALNIRLFVSLLWRRFDANKM